MLNKHNISHYSSAGSFLELLNWLLPSYYSKSKRKQIVYLEELL